MRFTQYLATKKVSKAKWKVIKADLENMLAYRPLVDGKPIEDLEPELTDNHLVLQGFETFCIERSGSADFCKTGRRPYDILVCASLLILHKHGVTTKVRTDGYAKDWMPALTFLKTIGIDAMPEDKLPLYAALSEDFQAISQLAAHILQGA